MSGASPRTFAEWHPDGRVRPVLVSRLEWLVKDVLRAARRRTGRGRRPLAAFDLGAVYGSLGADRTTQAVWLKRTFRLALDEQQAIDVSLAALALALDRGDRARAEGLLTFLPLCYPAAELDDAIPRMRRELSARAAEQRTAPQDIDCDAGWEAFAQSVRRRAESMLPRQQAEAARRVPDLPPRRVVVRLSGGLGNQMFQYAAALAYARRCGLPLRLDLANYHGWRQEREFLLGRLCVPIRRANSFEVVWSRLRPHRQQGMELDEFMFGDSGSAWLSGFWEDGAYFVDILPTVRRRLQPRDPQVIARAHALVERARGAGGPVIGVHLRRGDRAPGGVSFAPFSTLPPAYFREAEARFSGERNFLVFSDTPEDIAWCRDHLGLGEDANVTFGEGRDPILDMFALVKCDHVILSAGTFSWWAGYLGERPGRRVIVPNALQGMSAEWASLAVRPRPAGWEEVTLAPGSAG